MGDIAHIAKLRMLISDRWITDRNQRLFDRIVGDGIGSNPGGWLADHEERPVDVRQNGRIALSEAAHDKRMGL